MIFILVGRSGAGHSRLRRFGLRHDIGMDGIGSIATVTHTPNDK
jgi:hypothetical protein